MSSLSKSFSDVLTFEATGNRTMVDSDGVLKWAPHNLLTYSEDFSNAAWQKISGGAGSSPTVTTNFAVAPDGTQTANRIVASISGGSTSSDYALVRQVYNSSQIEEGNSQHAVWLKSNNGLSQVITISYSGAPSTVTVTSEWQLFTVSPNVAVNGNHECDIGLRGDTTGETCDVLVWGAHLYRSDLGGMVNNPDRGDSYVPTTDSAVFLPRRGHHVYDGSQWVNKGLLLESESRTNLLDYSNSFDNTGVWQTPFGATIAKDAIGPDGEDNSASTLTSSGSLPQIFTAGITVATSTQYTASIFAKAGNNNWLRFFCEQFTTPINGEGAWFDLDAGAVGTVDSGVDGATIDNYGNGWYRCSVTFTTDTTDTLGRLTWRSVNGDNIENGTSGQTVVFYGAQFEEASTPSSYIPTNGSTLIRAGETLTAPSDNLPWPEPVVIGEELVTNGTFDDGTTGWSAFNSTLSESGGVLTVTATSSGFVSAYQTLTTTAGSVYALSISGLSGTGARVRAYDNAVASTPISEVIVEDGVYYFVSLDTDVVVNVYPSGGSATIGDTVSIDNISVREINPLAVSIAMEGEVTYADEDVSAVTIGNGSQVDFLVWKLNNTNFIAYNMATNSEKTGEIIFAQREEISNLDLAREGNDGSYSPGILVPFNIASRHGSTFINGAVDGTALTANTTPTALPDLSSTDLEIGPDFMGTIKSIRIWADDIGDDGIEEASS